jgi:hypothetical protein
MNQGFSAPRMPEMLRPVANANPTILSMSCPHARAFWYHRSLGSSTDRSGTGRTVLLYLCEALDDGFDFKSSLALQQFLHIESVLWTPTGKALPSQFPQGRIG